MANGETFDEIRKIVEGGEGLSRKQTDMLILAALADMHKEVYGLRKKLDKESEARGKELDEVRKLAYLAVSAAIVALIIPELRDTILKAVLSLLGL